MNNHFPLPEWHQQVASVIVWPHQYSDWLPRLTKITKTYLEMAKVISHIQPLIIVHYDHEHKNLIEELCSSNNCHMQFISFVEIKTNDTWIRDYGPQFVSDSQSLIYLDMEFNAWGEHYTYDLDNAFSENFYKALNQTKMEYARIPLVVEGGNLDFNSQGILLTNLACIKRNNPNKSYTDTDLIEQLKNIFHAKQVIGLNSHALTGDDTGGHIDTLARFINDEVIVHAATLNSDDPNHSCLQSLSKQLKSNKQTCQLVPIELPSTPVQTQDGDYLPTSYINFVFLNEFLLVPLYNDPNDAIALKTFSTLCPDRNIIGIDASELIQQFGSLHCATLHLPKNTR